MRTVAPFQLDVTLDAKAVVSVDDDGDLYIEGYAGDYRTDRDQEAFEDGAFNEGIKAFLATNPLLAWHHQADRALGQVLQARLDAKGLWVKARIDKPAAGSWAEDVYAKVKRGTIRAFSVGGLFHRHMTPKGPRIFKADIAEISVTPLGVNPHTLFAVAGKAFDSDEGADLKSAEDAVSRLEKVLAVLSQQRLSS